MISYLVTGVLIGAITLLILPKANPAAKSPEQSLQETQANTQTTSNEEKTQKPPSDDSHRPIDQFRSKVIDTFASEDKERIQKMLERYDNDRSLELKLCLFKFFLVVIFIGFFVILLNGNLNLVEFYEKLKDELSFYKQLFQL